MKKNMSGTDRTIRLIVSVVFAILFFTGTVKGFFGVLLLIIAIVFAFTVVTGFCPIYKVLGISSCKNEKPKE